MRSVHCDAHTLTTFTTPYIPAWNKTAQANPRAHVDDRRHHVCRWCRYLLDDSGAEGDGTHRQILGSVMVDALRRKRRRRRGNRRRLARRVCAAFIFMIAAPEALVWPDGRHADFT
jgi:hypothetical protein